MNSYIKITLLEQKLYQCLKVIIEDIQPLIKSEDSTILTILDNSIYYLKHRGKARISSIINEIDSKEINEYEYENLIKKIDAYIRITDRKCAPSEINLKKIEINSVWAREAIGNLHRDLKLNELKEINITHSINISYNKNKNTVWEAKKIA